MYFSSLSYWNSGSLVLGTLVLNPQGHCRHYQDDNFENTYFEEDVIYTERNSRDFKQHIQVVELQYLKLSVILTTEFARGPSSSAIKQNFYPKCFTSANY